MFDIHKMTIKEIKHLLTDGEPAPDLLEVLMSDSRSGVRNLLEQYQRNQERKRALEAHWSDITTYERYYQEQGMNIIAGVDEVGRGPLAGPVVAAAVILPPDFYLPGINDSKKLSANQREYFYKTIKEKTLTYSIAFVDADVIDEINIYQATLKAIREAVAGLSMSPQICLVDGLEVSGLSVNQKAIVGGDRLSATIAAASIIAKVTRDRWMNEASERYPEYGFERHAGYPTPHHLQAVRTYGPSPLHRKTFAGVKEWVK